MMEQLSAWWVLHLHAGLQKQKWSESSGLSLFLLHLPTLPLLFAFVLYLSVGLLA